MKEFPFKRGDCFPVLRICSGKVLSYIGVPPYTVAMHVPVTVVDDSTFLLDRASAHPAISQLITPIGNTNLEGL
jgi:hypothetical protein